MSPGVFGLGKKIATSIYRRILQRQNSAPQEASVAEWAERGSGLLAGGISAQRIPDILGTHQFSEASPGTAARWGMVCAVWRIAERTGAPRASALTHVAAALRALDRLQERRRVLLAAPRCTVILVCALPLLAWAMGWGLGFDPLARLFTGWGVVVALVGLALLGLGVWWMLRMISRLAACDAVVGMECVLLSVALGGGGDVRSAIRLVGTVVEGLGHTWCDLGVFAPGGAVARVVSLSRTTGTPLGGLLLIEAEESRRRAHVLLEAAAERMSVSVLIPLGVCILPAFILLGVVPLAMGVFGTVW